MPGANHVGIRVADCKFGGEFFPLHLGKKLVDKENYDAKYCGCADGFKLFAFAAAALTVE